MTPGSTGRPSSTHSPSRLPQNNINTGDKDPTVEVGWEQCPFNGLSYSGGEDTTRDVSPGELHPPPTDRQSAPSSCPPVRVTQGTMLWEKVLLAPSFAAPLPHYLQQDTQKPLPEPAH